MNRLFKMLKAKASHPGKKGMKNSVISIVILLEIIALLIVGTFAWVETVSSIKITNEANTVGRIKNDTKYTDMMIGGESGTINLLDYFEPSGDMHLAPASSADGKTLYFPKANIGSNVIYRKGNVNDKNTTYLSASFRLRADTNADFFFWKDTGHDISVDNNIRVSVTAYTEGENPEGTYDPKSGKLISNTKIYANNASTTAVVNSTSGATGATTVEKFTDHQKGKSSTARLFAVGANETKYVTINVWLQKQSGNSDLTSNMSVSQAINNLGITSSLTPRHVTLLPTPTWDQSGVDETFYAWCWGATNGDASRLYKLELDDNEHYGFDYNGTYQNTLFIRSGNANLTKEYLEANNGEHWNDNTIWNVTENTSIPNDPVDPTFIIETINGSTLSGDDKYDPSNKKNISDWDTNPNGRPKKSTGSWHDPATVKVALCTGQGGENPWGTLEATSYVGSTTSTHVIESTNPDSQKHKDTIHAWPGKKLQLKATAKTNYAFVGWYLDADGTTPASGTYTDATYTPNAPSTASEITYYAKFKETRTFTINRMVDGNLNSTVAAGTITVNDNSTTSTGRSKTVTVDKGASVTFSAAAERGYTLEGIYTASSYGTLKYGPNDGNGNPVPSDYPEEASIKLNNNTTYYARFTTNKHKVNLRTIGSTGSTVQYGSETASTSVTKTDVKYNSSVTINANPAAGYEFVGWYTNPSGTGTAESTDASYSFTLGDADVTYYAKFDIADYYLTGYINGADESGTTHHFSHNGNGVFTYTYTFTGGSDQWVTVYDGTNAYHPGTNGAGSGTAANTSLTDTTPAGPNGNKWKIPAPKGTTVTITWDSGTKKLSWTLNSRELYLKPNSKWTQSSARFAAYVYGNGEAWYSMTSAGSGYYKVTVPASYPNIIFVRMNGSTSTNNWNNKWNQTGDLTIPSDKNCFTVPDGDWDGSTTTWSLY